MSEAEVQAACEKPNGDIAQHSDRCLQRSFVVLQEQAAFEACVADAGALNERKAALDARLRSLGAGAGACAEI